VALGHASSHLRLEVLRQALAQLPNLPARPSSPSIGANPGEWTPGLGSAKPLACDATAGSAQDAVAASRTISRRGRRGPPLLASVLVLLVIRHVSRWVGARQAGPSRQRPGAGAGPRRAQRAALNR
jgi:hypothetical protein